MNKDQALDTVIVALADTDAPINERVQRAGDALGVDFSPETVSGFMTFKGCGCLVSIQLSQEPESWESEGLCYSCQTNIDYPVNPEWVPIGLECKRHRQKAFANGWSRDKVAQAVGVTVPDLCKIEQGRIDPSKLAAFMAWITPNPNSMFTPKPKVPMPDTWQEIEPKKEYVSRSVWKRTFWIGLSPRAHKPQCVTEDYFDEPINDRYGSMLRRGDIRSLDFVKQQIFNERWWS